MRIDAHQHFWHYDPSMIWISDEMSTIRKNFTPKELTPILQENNFDGCIAVQVNQTPEENDYMINFAQQHTIIKGIVGWVDFCNPSIEGELEKLSEQKIMKGFRHILQGESKDDYMLRKDFILGISKLKQFDFTYDLLIKPQHLLNAISLVKQFPHQKFVIDHIAKPDIINKNLSSEWIFGMKELAKLENVWCKLSGMVTEANWHTWTKLDINPYIDLVLNSFGPSRIIYGSDWPVCLVAASYKRTLQLVEESIQKLSITEQEQIMGKTAVQLYNL